MVTFSPLDVIPKPFLETCWLPRSDHRNYPLSPLKFTNQNAQKLAWCYYRQNMLPNSGNKHPGTSDLNTRNLYPRNLYTVLVQPSSFPSVMVVIRQAQRARCTNAETIGEPMHESKKSGTSRELFALGLVNDSTLGPTANDWVTPSPSADGRYSLRRRDRFHKVVRPTEVTEPKPQRKSHAVPRSKKGSNGPGYQCTTIEVCKKGIECTICAEVRGR